MKHRIFDSLAKAGIEIQPGQVYWFHAPKESNGFTASFINSYINENSTIVSNGVQYQVIEMIAPTPELVGKVVGRRINLGSLGKYHLMMNNFLDIRGLIYHLSDVSSLDDREFVDLSSPYATEPCFGNNELFSAKSSSLWDDDEDEGISFLDGVMFNSAPSGPMEECLSLPFDSGDEMEDVSDDWEEAEETKETESNLLSFARPSSIHFSYNRNKRAKREATDAEDVKDKQEVENLEKAKDELLKRLTAVIVDYVNTTHQMPPMEEIYAMIKGKVVLTPTGLSRLVVNDQLRIFLPDYNELEVSFRPLPMTIYLLFLRHLDGIVLNYIGDYARELEEIYSIVMPNRDEKSALKSIQSLTDTLSGSLNQKLAVIKRTFKANILNEEAAAKYYISGSRGYAYKIGLPKELIQLPAVFK